MSSSKWQESGGVRYPIDSDDVSVDTWTEGEPPSSSLPTTKQVARSFRIRAKHDNPLLHQFFVTWSIRARGQGSATATTATTATTPESDSKLVNQTIDVINEILFIKIMEVIGDLKDEKCGAILTWKCGNSSLQEYDKAVERCDKEIVSLASQLVDIYG